MSRPLKQSTTVETQLEILASRGMEITDNVHAHRWLTHVGYYRLSGFSIRTVSFLRTDRQRAPAGSSPGRLSPQ